MKMLIFCSFLCLCSTFVSAQNVFVEYNFYRNFLTPEAKAKIAALSPDFLKKFENEYDRFELTANVTNSKYQHVKIMYKDTLMPRGNNTNQNPTVYLDFVAKYIYQTNVSMPDKVGRDTLLPVQDWQMVAGEKEIAGYICKKAMRKDDKGTEIVAWFTLEIPIQQGPHAIYGLPGLVLGVETKHYSEFAQKVVLLQQMELFKIPLADTYLTLKELSDEVFGRTMENMKQKHSKK